MTENDAERIGNQINMALTELETFLCKWSRVHGDLFVSTTVEDIAQMLYLYAYENLSEQSLEAIDILESA